MGQVTIKLRRGFATEWTARNPTLAAGEPGLEIDTNRVKYGDGSTRWSDLPYSAAGTGGLPLDLSEHVNSSTPHPVYDDMQSLVGLYENAKV